MKSYFEALGAIIPETAIAKKGGLSYLSAATAMQQAELPAVSFTDFEGQPYLRLFDGAVVAVDMPIKGVDPMQRTWLPVMDQNNRTIKLENITVSDINNSRQRCLVKAIATVQGVGMSVFLGADGDGKQAIKMLGLSPASDLTTAQAVFDKLPGGELYLGWNVALAAARIVDPSFFWRIIMWDDKPYREVLGGIFIDIELYYKGKRQQLSMPVLDDAFNSVPANKVTVWLWNRTVMRTLAKAIAFTTGYGLSVYAEDFGKSSKAGSESNAKAEESESTLPPKPEAKTQAGSTATKLAQKTSASAVSSASAKSQEARTQFADTTQRFKAVVNKRFKDAGLEGVFGLFEAIQKTTKYTEAEKPVCYYVLLTSLAAMLTDKSEFNPVTLLELIAKYQALQYVPQDAHDLLCTKLISICFDRTDKLGDVGLFPQLTVLCSKAGLVSATEALEAFEAMVQEAIARSKSKAKA